MRTPDLIGQRFGRLTVIAKSTPVRYSRWHCKCDCGGQRIVNLNSLRCGYTKSCGCLHSELASARLRKLHAERRGPPQYASGKRDDAWRDLAAALA